MEKSTFLKQWKKVSAQLTTHSLVAACAANLTNGFVSADLAATSPEQLQAMIPGATAFAGGLTAIFLLSAASFGAAYVAGRIAQRKQKAPELNYK
jgi:uncharacterized membrane protein YhhN